MIDEEKVNKNLTEYEGISLDTLIVSIDDMAVEPPVRSYKDVLVAARLSPSTLRQEERRIAREARKRHSLRNRKKYTRRRGRVHPKKKEATARRKRAREWAERPFDVLIGRNRYACKRLDRQKWDEYIAPLWEQHDPAMLEVVFARGSGTRVNPYTVYNLTVIHKQKGPLYKGADQLIYDLSAGNGKP